MMSMDSYELMFLMIIKSIVARSIKTYNRPKTKSIDNYHMILDREPVVEELEDWFQKS